MEQKREALLREASDSSAASTLHDKLAQLDSIKPRPYGTWDAVCSDYLISLCLQFTTTMSYIFFAYKPCGSNMFPLSIYKFYICMYIINDEFLELI